jgi:hypothetical protein
MNKRDDIAAAESMSSPFEKQLCDHTQVTQDMFGVKEGESKKSKSPRILLIPLQIAMVLSAVASPVWHKTRDMMKASRQYVLPL